MKIIDNKIWWLCILCHYDYLHFINFIKQSIVDIRFFIALEKKSENSNKIQTQILIISVMQKNFISKADSYSMGEMSKISITTN